MSSRMHPFKRPRLRAVDDNQDANPTKAGLEHVQQSRTGSDWSSHKTSAMRSSSSGSTFDEIRSPSVAGVERALLELPRVTQPLRYPVRFRKQIGTDEDIEWTFKQVSEEPGDWRGVGRVSWPAEMCSMMYCSRFRSFTSNSTKASNKRL